MRARQEGPQNCFPTYSCLEQSKQVLSMSSGTWASHTFWMLLKTSSSPKMMQASGHPFYHFSVLMHVWLVDCSHWIFLNTLDQLMLVEAFPGLRKLLSGALGRCTHSQHLLGGSTIRRSRSDLVIWYLLFEVEASAYTAVKLRYSRCQWQNQTCQVSSLVISMPFIISLALL